MNTVNTTATSKQIALWLEPALASATRAANTTKNDKLRAIHQEEAAEIKRCQAELETGGIQTDLEQKKSK